MQGTRVRPLVWEDPTCRRATKPGRHNYWAWALEAVHHNYWARAPRSRALQQEKPQQWEAHAPQQRVAPARRNRRKAHAQQQRPNAAKKNDNKFIFKNKQSSLKYCENYQNMRQRQEVSKCCWKNGTDRLACCKVSTNLQFVKKCNVCKVNKVKHNKTKYAYTILDPLICWWTCGLYLPLNCCE